ncbi:MAG: hypothetical protein KDA80_11660 [Planctomycetaceae bacterium]|nr:hypothetical protein [Planctomycetaceae bacterium]
MTRSTAIVCLFLLLTVSRSGLAEHPFSSSGKTSLTDSTLDYRVPSQHFVVLKAGEVTAILVDNEAIDIPELPGHREGYNGIASLKHSRNEENLFVPAYAGINFEHIHDGTLDHLKEKFEPRKFPMQLRLVDQSTVELYQAPTGNFQLESCGRYHLDRDGSITYSFECRPHADRFAHGYIGLFWASYINGPEDKAIHFTGEPQSGGPPRAIRAVTPKHGVEAVHPPKGQQWFPTIDDDFPLSLVGNYSNYVYTEPSYFGIRDDLRFEQSFRSRDQIFFVQSPSGGGGNPAWDFQWFIPDCKVGETYGFTMTTRYTPVATESSSGRP